MKKVLDRALVSGISEVEVYFQENVSEEVLFENNKLKTVNTTQNAGTALRSVKDSKMSLVTSANLDDIDKMVNNAIEVCEFSSDKEFDFAGGITAPVKDYADSRIWDIPMEKLIEDGIRAVDIIKRYDSDILTSVRFKKETDNIKMASTNGLDAKYSRNRFTAGLKCSLVRGTSFIECTGYDNNLTGEYSIEKLTNECMEVVSLCKNEYSVESGKKTVILTPAALSGILLTIQMGVSGNAVERGVSPLKGRIGEKILSDKITIIDDGTLENGYDSMSFDDEGIPAQRTVLFEKGVLKGYIHTLKSAQKLGFTPTGNGLRHQNLINAKKYDLMPRPCITNLIMEPGCTKYEDMIRDIKDGIIIDNIMGILMNNLINGDFSGNIGMGYLIKNGKIVGRIKDAAINENIYSIFVDKVVELSDKVKRTPFFGEIGSHFYPYMMLKDINIAGK